MDGTAQRILIVDDEEAITFALGRFLRMNGLEVDTAAELEEAKGKIAAVDYQLVITDLRLTTIHTEEGFDLIRFIQERSSGTRIVLLTAYCAPEVIAEARARGADRVLTKPQQLDDIAAVVRELLAEPGP